MPWSSFSELFLGPDSYEYIIICFERKDIMVNKYEKGNVCFSLLVCHIWLFSFFRNPAAKRSVSLPLVTILEGLNIGDDPLYDSRCLVP